MRDTSSWQPLLVTNLNDSGPGSLREALSQDTPRVIDFGVGGTIELESPLEVTHSMCHIRASSAPGMGVQLTNSGLQLLGVQDVYVDSLRVRCGPNGPNASNDQPLLVYGSGNGNFCDDIYIWNSSFAGATGNGDTAVWGDCRKVAILDSIFARGCTENGGHSTGLLIGSDLSQHLDITVERCLIAQSAGRNPMLQTPGRVMFRRNLVADPASYFMEIQMRYSNGTPFTSGFYSILGNVFWMGPSFVPAYKRRPIAVTAANPGSLDVRGNIVLGWPTSFPTQLQLCGYKSPVVQGHNSTEDVIDPKILVDNKGGNWGTTPQQARDILAGAGPKVRDAYDAGIVQSLLTGTAYDYVWQTPTLPSVPYDMPTKNVHKQWTQNPVRL